MKLRLKSADGAVESASKRGSRFFWESYGLVPIGKSVRKLALKRMLVMMMLRVCAGVGTVVAGDTVAASQAEQLLIARALHFHVQQTATESTTATATGTAPGHESEPEPEHKREEQAICSPLFHMCRLWWHFPVHHPFLMVSREETTRPIRLRSLSRENCHVVVTRFWPCSRFVVHRGDLDVGGAYPPSPQTPTRTSQPM